MEEESPSEQHPAEEPAKASPGKKLLGATIQGLRATGGLLQTAALYFFMLLLPLVITAYPGYLIVNELVQSTRLSPVEATLANIDINRVQDGESGLGLFKSKGHTNVTLLFKGQDGKKYSTVIEMPWTAPGLRKQMDEKYGERESFTLYVGKDGIAQIDEQVAGTRMMLLSMLMSLVLVTTALAIFLRHRLSERMPSLVSHESAANARSMIYGQLATLVVAFLFTVVMHYTPLVVSYEIFLGAYWGAAILIGISLRLLVFQNPPPPPPPVEEDPKERKLR
jgi:hypothetical protein